MPATLLPNAETQFIDGNGKPIAGGSVYFYVPNTTTFKNTWQDSAKTILNTNPVILDGAGRAIIWGSGTYRQVLYDQFGNLVWDQITEDSGGGTLGDITDNLFHSGVDFTPGVTTQLTLSVGPGSIANTWVFFDGTYQTDDGITLSGTTTLVFSSPIPVGVQEVTVKIGSTVAIGTPGAGTVTDNSVAMGTKLYNRIHDTVFVQDFGAKGDGVTDDTAAIQAADSYARALGAQLYFPGATYMVSQLVINTGSNWVGDGRQATIIKQIIGSNKDLFYGVNSNANWGSSSPTGFAVGYTLRNLTLNGNWNNGSGNTSGSGIAVYGPRPILEDVFITNVAEHGMRTEYTDAAGGIDTFTMEGHYKKIQVDTCGKHGWWNAGPHDMTVLDMTVVDAGQLTDSTYSGFYLDTKCTGGFVRLHAWTRSTSLRMAWGLRVNAGAQGDFVACHFEGASLGNVGLFAQNCTFDPTCHYYSAWNGVNFFMGGICTTNVIRGVLEGPAVGRPASIGLYMGSIGTDFISDNDIDVKINSNETSNIQWTGGVSFGNNKIRALCFNTTSTTITGTPGLTDDVYMMFHSNGVTSHVNNRTQNFNLSVPGTGSATWTFPYAFSGTPTVTIAPVGGSGSAGGVWISSISSTSVTIFNNNPALNVFITASAPN